MKASKTIAMTAAAIAAVCAVAYFTLLQPLPGKRLRAEIAAIEDGETFRLNELYRKAFDSVYIFGPYSNIDAPSYMSQRKRERVESILWYDNRSALIFVRGGRVAGICILERERFDNIRDTVIGADTGLLIHNNPDDNIRHIDITGHNST